MKIYKPEPPESPDYELCHTIDDGEDLQTIIAQINGEPRQQSWKPITMELVREDEGKRLLESDSPWLGTFALIFRDQAVEALGPLLTENGELLPLLCNEAKLFVFNPIPLLDVLDEATSNIWRYSDGNIMWIKQHVFSPEVIGNVDAFKIANMRASPTFVSERFVERWTASGLVGLEFKEVWSSDNPVAPEATKESAVVEELPDAEPKPKPGWEALVDGNPQEIEALVAQGWAELGLGDAPSPQETAEAVERWLHVMQRREMPLEAEAASPVALAWGDAVARQIGWDWGYFLWQGMEVIALASPNRANAHLPVTYILEQLEPGTEITALLLFNMLAAGQRPPAQPGDLCAIS